MDGPPLWRATQRHGRGRAPDWPQVRGKSDFNTACRWHGTADVALFRVRPPRSYEKRSSNGLDQERATATEIDARALVPSTTQCHVALTCLCSCVTLEWRDAAQGNTRSLGDHRAWSLFSRPPERAHEQCARCRCLGPTVCGSSAGGLCRPGNAASRTGGLDLG